MILLYDVWLWCARAELVGISRVLLIMFNLQYDFVLHEITFSCLFGVCVKPLALPQQYALCTYGLEAHTVG